MFHQLAIRCRHVHYLWSAPLLCHLDLKGKEPCRLGRLQVQVGLQTNTETRTGNSGTAVCRREWGFVSEEESFSFELVYSRVEDVEGAQERRSTKGQGLLRKPSCFHRAFNKSHPAFVELSTEAKNNQYLRNCKRQRFCRENLQLRALRKL